MLPWQPCNPCYHDNNVIHVTWQTWQQCYHDNHALMLSMSTHVSEDYLVAVSPSYNTHCNCQNNHYTDNYHRHFIATQGCCFADNIFFHHCALGYNGDCMKMKFKRLKICKIQYNVFVSNFCTSKFITIEIIGISPYRQMNWWKKSMTTYLVF